MHAADPNFRMHSASSSSSSSSQHAHLHLQLHGVQGYDSSHSQMFPSPLAPLNPLHHSLSQGIHSSAALSSPYSFADVQTPFHSHHAQSPGIYSSNSSASSTPSIPHKIESFHSPIQIEESLHLSSSSNASNDSDTSASSSPINIKEEDIILFETSSSASRSPPSESISSSSSSSSSKRSQRQSRTLSGVRLLRHRLTDNLRRFRQNEQIAVLYQLCDDLEKSGLLNKTLQSLGGTQKRKREGMKKEEEDEEEDDEEDEDEDGMDDSDDKKKSGKKTKNSKRFPKDRVSVLKKTIHMIQTLQEEQLQLQKTLEAEEAKQKNGDGMALVPLSSTCSSSASASCASSASSTDLIASAASQAELASAAAQVGADSAKLGLLKNTILVLEQQMDHFQARSVLSNIFRKSSLVEYIFGLDGVAIDANETLHRLTPARKWDRMDFLGKITTMDGFVLNSISKLFQRYCHKDASTKFLPADSTNSNVEGVLPLDSPEEMNTPLPVTPKEEVAKDYGRFMANLSSVDVAEIENEVRAIADSIALDSFAPLRLDALGPQSYAMRFIRSTPVNSLAQVIPAVFKSLCGKEYLRSFLDAFSALFSGRQDVVWHGSPYLSSMGDLYIVYTYANLIRYDDGSPRAIHFFRDIKGISKIENNVQTVVNNLEAVINARTSLAHAHPQQTPQQPQAQAQASTNPSVPANQATLIHAFLNHVTPNHPTPLQFPSSSNSNPVTPYSQPQQTHTAAAYPTVTYPNIADRNTPLPPLLQTFSHPSLSSSNSSSAFLTSPMSSTHSLFSAAAGPALHFGNSAGTTSTPAGPVPLLSPFPFSPNPYH